MRKRDVSVGSLGFLSLNSVRTHSFPWKKTNGIPVKCEQSVCFSLEFIWRFILTCAGVWLRKNKWLWIINFMACRMWDILKRTRTRVYVEIKCQLDATGDFFIADLIACSTYFGHTYAHHQELKSIIQWILCVVFGALVFKLSVWQHPTNRTHNPQLYTRPATWKPQHEISQAATTV